MQPISKRPVNCICFGDEELNMDALMAAAASGIRARIESLDILANNLANASAAGASTKRWWPRISRRAF